MEIASIQLGTGKTEDAAERAISILSGAAPVLFRVSLSWCDERLFSVEKPRKAGAARCDETPAVHGTGVSRFSPAWVG